MGDISGEPAQDADLPKERPNALQAYATMCDLPSPNLSRGPTMDCASATWTSICPA